MIRDYLTVTRSIDLHELERARMVQVSAGKVPDPPGIRDGIVYVALQELATRIAHRNTGKLLDDPAGEAVMSRVAADENLHHIFYRDLVAAALELDPSGMVAAIDRQVRTFEMPGAGIPDFATHARAIADVGVYDFKSHHDKILVPVVFKHWRIEQLQNLKAAAEQARDRVDQPHRARRPARPSGWRPAAPAVPLPPSDRPRAASAQRLLVERVLLELHEPALHDAVVRPRRAPGAPRVESGRSSDDVTSSFHTSRAVRARRGRVRARGRAGPARSPVTVATRRCAGTGLVDADRAAQLVRQRRLDHHVRGAAGARGRRRRRRSSRNHGHHSW